MLDHNSLGTDLYNVRQTFSNKSADELLMLYGTWDNVRLAACKAEAKAIIDHFKSSAVLTVPGTPMVAGPYPVTGTSVTGTIS